MWKCVVRRGIPCMSSLRVTFIGFESILRWVAALDFIATQTQKTLVMRHLDIGA